MPKIIVTISTSAAWITLIGCVAFGLRSFANPLEEEPELASVSRVSSACASAPTCQAIKIEVAEDQNLFRPNLAASAKRVNDSSRVAQNVGRHDHFQHPPKPNRLVPPVEIDIDSYVQRVSRFDHQVSASPTPESNHRLVAWESPVADFALAAQVDLEMLADEPGKADTVITLTIGYGKTESIRVEGRRGEFVRITQFNVSDRNVCEAAITGSNKLQVIATGLGRAHIDVRATVKRDDATEIKRQYRIDLICEQEGLSAKLGDLLPALDRAIKRIYSECQVSIVVERDRLVVTGQCESRNTADRVIDMIRKVCLVAVVDELKTPESAPMPIPHAYPAWSDYPCTCGPSIEVSGGMLDGDVLNEECHEMGREMDSGLFPHFLPIVTAAE